jgi:predicted DNA-binding WGR domain protein
MVLDIVLHAVDKTRNCRRSYRLVVERDLLGDWLVRLAFGRIGARGRIIIALAADEAEARRVARAILRRRASAPRRIGVAYRPVEQFANEGWDDIWNDHHAVAHRQK